MQTNASTVPPKNTKKGEAPEMQIRGNLKIHKGTRCICAFFSPAVCWFTFRGPLLLLQLGSAPQACVAANPRRSPPSFNRASTCTPRMRCTVSLREKKRKHCCHLFELRAIGVGFFPVGFPIPPQLLIAASSRSMLSPHLFNQPKTASKAHFEPTQNIPPSFEIQKKRESLEVRHCIPQAGANARGDE